MGPRLQSSSLRPDETIRLKVNNLCFLDKGPFSFSITAGECLGLSGQSGVGKSLLLKALTDLISFRGTVTLDGVSISSYPAPEWRSKVTMVAAESFWWYDRVHEHFSRQKGSTLFANHLSDLGFSTDVLNWKISRMSTGERQRLALLRSLVNTPQVLLLDEPTSNLDSHNTELVEKFVCDYRAAHRTTMIWVSHDEAQLQRVAVRFLQMTKERVIETTGTAISEFSD